MSSAAKRKCTKCEKMRKASSYSSAGAYVCTPCKRGASALAARARRLKEKYGITLEDYARMLAAQGGKCAGCKGKRRYHLHVDHDHALERELLAMEWAPEAAARASVRGLLCARCNKLLRDSRDSRAILTQLADYLDDPPAIKVLELAA